MEVFLAGLQISRNRIFFQCGSKWHFYLLISSSKRSLLAVRWLHKRRLILLSAAEAFTPASQPLPMLPKSPTLLAAKAFDLNLKNASGNASSPFFAWTKKNCLPASPTYFWSDMSWDSLNGLKVHVGEHLVLLNLVQISMVFLEKWRMSDLGPLGVACGAYLLVFVTCRVSANNLSNADEKK